MGGLAASRSSLDVEQGEGAGRSAGAHCSFVGFIQVPYLRLCICLLVCSGHPRPSSDRGCFPENQGERGWGGAAGLMKEVCSAPEQGRVWHGKLFRLTVVR